MQRRGGGCDKAARRIATLEAAAAAADAALAQPQPQNAPVDDVVREWLDDLLYQVEGVVWMMSAACMSSIREQLWRVRKR